MQSDIRVVEVNSNTYKLSNGEIARGRKKVRRQSDIVVGDFVELDTAITSENIIDKVLPRKNTLIRPNIANIDQIIVVVSSVPEVDYLLLDKLIINCHRQFIDVILCVNKTDLDKRMKDELLCQYGDTVTSIISTCALNNEVSELRSILKGKLSCLAGQSAVGKSTIINCLFPEINAKIGELSDKIQRGKNTTTFSSLYSLGEDTYIIDTPGFSMLDLHDVTLEELDLFFDEFSLYSPKCKYSRCTHTLEPFCAVRQAVSDGQINNDRYLRYINLRKELEKRGDTIWKRKL